MSRAASRSRSGGRPRRRRRSELRAGCRGADRRAGGVAVSRPRCSKASKATSKPPGARSSLPSMLRPRCGTRSPTPRPRGSASGRRSDAWRSRRATSRSSVRHSPPHGWPPRRLCPPRRPRSTRRGRCAAGHEASLTAARSEHEALARELQDSRTRPGRPRCPAPIARRAGCRACRVRRRRPRGPRAGQRRGQPAGCRRGLPRRGTRTRACRRVAAGRPAPARDRAVRTNTPPRASQLVRAAPGGPLWLPRARWPEPPSTVGRRAERPGPPPAVGCRACHGTPRAGDRRRSRSGRGLPDPSTRPLTAARETGATVATLQRRCRPRRVISSMGATAAESRGILATKGEIRELRERHDRRSRGRAGAGCARRGLEHTISRRCSAPSRRRTLDLHQHEKAIVGHEAQLARAAEEHARIARTAEMLALDRRRAEEEGIRPRRAAGRGARVARGVSRSSSGKPTRA